MEDMMIKNLFCSIFVSPSHPSALCSFPNLSCRIDGSQHSNHQQTESLIDYPESQNFLVLGP